MSDPRPNILLIQADQLAAEALGAYGNETVLSPNMDALASEGAVFEHAYCNSPLCVPSRSSMMTGELPSTIGVYDNAAELPASTPTFAHQVRARGYRTALVGRMHFIGPDQLHGFEERPTTDVYPADLGMIPDWGLSESERLPWYHDAGSVFGAGVSAATLQRDYDEEVLFQTIRQLGQMARDADERPFLMVSSFIHPHDPYEPPREHWERYEGVEIDPPRVPDVPEEKLDAHSRRLRIMCELDREQPPPETVLRARRAYYASVSYIDDKVGQIMRTLSELGLRERTIVLLTSDHGDMRGERGLWYKMAPFEGSVRVPLIVSAPGLVPAARIARTASLVDLLPTFAEIAEGRLGLLDGAAPAATSAENGRAAGTSGWEPAAHPPAAAGRSLVGLLRGRQAGWPDRAVIEYLAEGVHAPQLTLVRGRLKLVHAPGDPDMLFDLDSDPLELVTLAGEPAYAETLADLRADLLEGRDLEALAGQVRGSQERRRLVHEALTRGRPSAWDHRPRDRSAQAYVRGDFWTAINEGRLRDPA